LTPAVWIIGGRGIKKDKSDHHIIKYKALLPIPASLSVGLIPEKGNKYRKRIYTRYSSSLLRQERGITGI
jgi:hypothetical protein